MTTQECTSRDLRMVDNIRAVILASPGLGHYAVALQVSIEDAAVVLRGELPRAELKDLLVSAVRQAGVLNRVSDFVRIAS